MDRIYCAVRNLVVYRSRYEQPVRFGDTSGGELNVSWLGDAQRTFEAARSAGLECAPWGFVCPDVLGQIRLRLLEDLGFDTGAMREAPYHQTPFHFALTEPDSRRLMRFDAPPGSALLPKLNAGPDALALLGADIFEAFLDSDFGGEGRWMRRVLCDGRYALYGLDSARLDRAATALESKL